MRLSGRANPWKTLGSRVVYKSRFVELREDDVIQPDGSPGKYTVFTPATGKGNLTVPVSSQGEIYFIGVWRYPTSRYFIELPGGGTDEKEDPLHAAKRELSEETGLVSFKWKKLGSLSSSLSSYAVASSDVFLAEDVEDSGRNNKEGETIDATMKIPPDEVLRMIQNGEISESYTINAIFLYFLHSGFLKRISD